MPTILRRDANRVPIQDKDGNMVYKTMTFAGGTANDPGDYDGTGNPATLFTVSGTVIVRLIAICDVDLAGASATLEVGITGSTAALIALTTATNIDAGEIWHDATPDAKIELDSVSTAKILADGQDIIQTAKTANITGGKITYYCLWRPISDGASVVAA